MGPSHLRPPGCGYSWLLQKQGWFLLLGTLFLPAQLHPEHPGMTQEQDVEAAAVMEVWGQRSE